MTADRRQCARRRVWSAIGVPSGQLVAGSRVRLWAVNPAIWRPVAAGPWTRSRTACALRMSRREMLGERQVAAPLMAQRAAHRALGLAHRRFQPGQGVGIQLAGLRLSGKPQRPSQCQFGHQTLILAFTLFAPAASRPGQHCAVRRRRGRQVAPRGHTSTVGQRFLRLVLRDDRRSDAEHPVRHRLGEPPCPYGSGTGNGGTARGYLRRPRAIGRPGRKECITYAHTYALDGILTRDLRDIAMLLQPLPAL